MSITGKIEKNLLSLRCNQYFIMLPQTILDKIMEKYGKQTIYSADCAPLAAMMGVSETTVKRMFGLVGKDSPEKNRVPHNSTMDIVSKWLGYTSYKELLCEIGEGDSSSEFTSLHKIETKDLTAGTQIQIRYEPARVLVMTYLGDEKFLINESKNSKLLKGDMIRLTSLVLEHEMIVSEVIRGGRSLGGYRGAKDGGLTSLEVIV